jgi:hypothetical protein
LCGDKRRFDALAGPPYVGAMTTRMKFPSGTPAEDRQWLLGLAPREEAKALAGGVSDETLEDMADRGVVEKVILGPRRVAFRRYTCLQLPHPWTGKMFGPQNGIAAECDSLSGHDPPG